MAKYSSKTVCTHSKWANELTLKMFKKMLSIKNAIIAPQLTGQSRGAKLYHTITFDYI